jgi:hypothetical protein
VLALDNFPRHHPDTGELVWSPVPEEIRTSQILEASLIQLADERDRAFYYDFLAHERPDSFELEVVVHPILRDSEIRRLPAASYRDFCRRAGELRYLETPQLLEIIQRNVEINLYGHDAVRTGGRWNTETWELRRPARPYAPDGPWHWESQGPNDWSVRATALFAKPLQLKYSLPDLLLLCREGQYGTWPSETLDLKIIHTLRRW